MRRCIFSFLLLCLISSHGAAQELNQNAISVYISYNLPVMYVPGAIVRHGPRPQSIVEISCRNNLDHEIEVILTGLEVTERNGISPVDPGKTVDQPAPVTLILLPQQMKTIAVRAFPSNYRLRWDTAYLLSAHFQVVSGKEKVPIDRVFPLPLGTVPIIPAGIYGMVGQAGSYVSDWTTVNGVAARVSIATARETIAVSAEIRNDTAKSIQFNDIPSLAGDIMPNGGAPLQPSVVKAVDREPSPLTLPPGATINLPMSHGYYDDQTGVFQMNFTSAEYLLKPEMHYLDARLQTTFDPEGTGIEWKIPRFPFMLRWPDMVPIYAPNPNDGWVEYPG